VKDFVATFLQVESTTPDVATGVVTLACTKVWNLETGGGPEQSGPCLPWCLEGQIVIAPRVDWAMSFLERDFWQQGGYGHIRTLQRIDLCSLAAPLLLLGHVQSVSLDALALYFGVHDSRTKLETMVEVWEGLLRAFLLKEGDRGSFLFGNRTR
jgi:hypothetical protein